MCASIQGFHWDKYEELLSSCSIYLDCNQGGEVWSSSLQALENGQVLFGLKSTVHDEAYKELEHDHRYSRRNETATRNIAPASRGLSKKC